MKRLLTILFLLPIVAIAQQPPKTLTTASGLKNSIAHQADGFGPDSVLFVPVCTGKPTINMAPYMAVYPKASIMYDLTGKWWGWSPALNDWSEIGGGGGLVVEKDPLSVHITDSAAMLLPYLQKVDTVSMLTPYLRKADTSAMLSPYLKISDTAAMLLSYLKYVNASTGLISVDKNTLGLDTLYTDARYLADGLITPGYVSWSGTGLTENVTGAVYVINSKRYTSASGSITLDPADPSNPRYDVIGLDTLGHIIKITGTPSANPVFPQVDPSYQLVLTTLAIPAGATTPGIKQEIVYDENTEAYSHNVTAGLTVNFDNFSTTFHGAKSMDVGKATATKYIDFIRFSGVDTATRYTIINLYIYLKDTLAKNGNISISLLSGTTAISTSVVLGANTGFQRAAKLKYQSVMVPMNAFTFATTTVFNRVRIALTGTTNGFYADYFQLQSGIPPVTPVTESDPVAINKTITVNSGAYTSTQKLNNNPVFNVPAPTLTETDPLSVHITDSAAMLAPYLRSNVAAATYRTQAQVRSDIALTTTGTSGAATYNNSTGVLNVPQYSPGITSETDPLSVHITDSAAMLAPYAKVSSGWSITGNAGIDRTVNFLGTTDNHSIRFRTNNIQRAIIDTLGRVGIGIAAPQQALDIKGSIQDSGNIYLSTYPVNGVNAGAIYVGGATAGNRFIHGFNYGNNGTVSTLGANTFVGAQAGNFTMGATATDQNQASFNTGIGGTSLLSLTTGQQNSALGNSSLTSNTTGNSNTAIGSNSMYGNTTGSLNTAVGYKSLQTNSGDYNVAVGYSAMFNNSGTGNTAVGTSALSGNNTGAYNVALGQASLESNTSGAQNVAIGFQALDYNSTGSQNVAIGFQTLLRVNTSGNIGIGNNTAFYNSDQSAYANALTNCIFIGNLTRSLNTNDNNAVVIGQGAISHGNSTTTLGGASTTVYVPSGTTSTAPLNIPAGIYKSVPVSGDIENDGNNLRYTKGVGTTTALNISLTTTGTSGAATFNTVNGVLNIPQYSGGGGGIQPTDTAAMLTPYLRQNVAAATYRTQAQVRSDITLTTTGTTGAATYNNSTGVLNVPQYGGGTPSLTATQVAFGDAGNLITSSANLTYSAGTLNVKNGSLSLSAGTTSTAPFNIPAGIFTSVPVSGNIENDGNNLRYTNSGGTPYYLLKSTSSGVLAKRVNTTASPVITPDVGNYDAIIITGLAVALTVNAPTGTPVQMQELTFRITDAGTAEPISWNAIYRASADVPLPAATTAGKTMYFKFYANTTSNTYDFMSLQIF